MWIKDGKIYNGGGVFVNGLRRWNPTAEEFIEAGYSEYNPPPANSNFGVYLEEFNSACAQFRRVCNQIKEAANLESFTGGFDEMVEFQRSLVYSTVAGLQLAIAWSAANELCKYTGSKVGYGQPAWWYHCWDEAEAIPEELEDSSTDQPVETN